MIKKENKLIQITLDPETLELLNSLALRLHNSKTDIIKQAIKIYGASKNQVYTVILHKPGNVNNTPNEPEENISWEELMDKYYKNEK